jgi:outer membrane protein insertion porin family
MVIGVLVMTVSTPVLASGEKITGVTVSGNRRIENTAVYNVLKVKSGDNFYEDKIDADVKAIFNLGYFTDVKVEKTVNDKEVSLNYIVTEKPIVRELLFEGNKAIGLDKLKETVEIRVNSIVSSKDLAKSVKKIRKLYTDEGYSQVAIDIVREPISPYEQKVVFRIAEGNKILISAIRFEGNRAFPAGKLKKLMETDESWWLSWLTSAGVYKEEVLTNDIALLTEFYMNNGYINVKIGEPKVSLTPDGKGLYVDLVINEGDQFRVGQISFRGDLLENRDELAKLIKTRSGELFSRGTLRQDIFTLTDLYADKGFAFANVSPLTQLQPELKLLDIVFDLEKGEKVYIDRIRIAGNAKTRDKVIRREIRLAEGDLYNATLLKKSKQNVMNLGFFEEANITTAKGRSDNLLNLNVDVKEKATGTFSVGGGYSSLDGFVGQGSVQQTNFLGLGLKANASVSIGGKSSTYNIGLLDPYFLDTKWSLGGDIYRTERQYVDYTRKATGADIKSGYQLSDSLSTFFLYKFETKSITKESLALQRTRNDHPELLSPQDSTTSSLTASITSNTTDYRMDPTSGMINSLSVEFAGLGGTNRFIRSIGQSSLFTPVGLGTVFMVHGTLGYMQEMGVTLPLDEKFYLGGIGTVRGYAGRTISPYVLVPDYDEKTGSPINTNTGKPRYRHAFIGGDSEAVFNAEYTVPLLKEAGLKGLVFFDAGNSVDGFGNVFSGLLTSYGVGIRWFSPIGPLRLEYGIPLNPRSGIDSNGKLEFSIGSFF